MIKESAFAPRAYTFSTPANWRQEYGEAKRQAESVFFNESNLNLAAVRFPFVLGTDDYTERLKFHVDRIKSGQGFYIPKLNAETSLIDSQDAADALFVLGTSEYRGPINCCTTEPISVQSLIEQIETIVGKKANLLAAASSESDVSPYGLDKTSYMDNSLARSLGLRFKPLSRWLPQLIKVS